MVTAERPLDFTQPMQRIPSRPVIVSIIAWSNSVRCWAIFHRPRLVPRANAPGLVAVSSRSILANSLAVAECSEECNNSFATVFQRDGFIFLSFHRRRGRQDVQPQ